MEKGINGQKTEIRPVDGEFELLVGGVRVRVDKSARVLSNWALANGANEVQWAFDLRLAEEWK